MASKKDMQSASNDALNKFFTQGTKNAQEGTETIQTGNSSPKESNGLKKANKNVKRVLSFRADSEIVAQFRAYGFAKYGMTFDQVGESALIEYMENHPLEKFEKDMYKTRLAEENSKN